MAVARTQERVNDARDAFDGANGSIAGFERMEQKAQQMLDEATAAAELSAPPADSAAELEEKYTNGSASVEDELARLKAEMEG